MTVGWGSLIYNHPMACGSGGEVGDSFDDTKGATVGRQTLWNDMPTNLPNPTKYIALYLILRVTTACQCWQRVSLLYLCSFVQDEYLFCLEMLEACIESSQIMVNDKHSGWMKHRHLQTRGATQLYEPTSHRQRWAGYSSLAMVHSAPREKNEMCLHGN